MKLSDGIHERQVMNRARELLKNTGILAVCNFASKILIFILVPLYTHALSTDEYGLYDLVISTVTLLYPILTCNIADAVMRFTMDKSIDRDDVARIGMKYILISIFLSLCILTIIKSLNLWPKINEYVIIIALYYFLYAFNQYLIQLAKGQEKLLDMGISAVLGTVFLIASNVVFLILIKLGIRGFFWANILSLGISVIYLTIKLRAYRFLRELLHDDKKLRSAMLSYSIPLIATTLGWWINSTADRYVVALMCGVAANGLLSISYKIPTIINTLQGIFIQAWQITAIKEYGEENTPIFYGRAFEIINILMCIACSCLIGLTKPISAILYQKDFYSAWQFVPFLLISCILNSASGFLGPILAAKKDSRSMAKSAVYGAISNIVMNIGLVYLLGIQGATIATVISSFIIYFVRKRAVGNGIEISRYRAVLLTWLLLCIQAILEIYTSLWWGEIILMIIMFALNLNGMKQVISIGKRILAR